jgi:N-methylhydantoinase A/oxoprolinase/acetone carboxylase beta subunit
VGERRVYFKEQGHVPTAVYRRELLAPGNVVLGPAVIEAVDTTAIVHPLQLARVDGWTNLLLEQA